MRQSITPKHTTASLKEMLLYGITLDKFLSCPDPLTGGHFEDNRGKARALIAPRHTTHRPTIRTVAIVLAPAQTF
jgi:hypothetical protein